MVCRGSLRAVGRQLTINNQWVSLTVFHSTEWADTSVLFPMHAGVDHVPLCAPRDVTCTGNITIRYNIIIVLYVAHDELCVKRVEVREHRDKANNPVY